MHGKVSKVRPAASYRGAHRNEVKAARMLPQWREYVATAANQKAKLGARAELANGAREAAAKALVGARGMRPDIVMAVAYLEFYETCQVKQTRSISRIIRELRVQVAKVERKAAA